MSHRAGYNRPYVPEGRLTARRAGPTGRGGPCRPLGSRLEAAAVCRRAFPATVLPAAGPTTAWATVTTHSTSADFHAR